MKNIIIAYHAFLFGNNYMAIIQEQLGLLQDTGLFDACTKLYIGIIDDPNKNSQSGIEWIRSFWKKSLKVEIIIYPANNEETDTMKWIRDYSKDNPDDYVLYFHTKGVTKNTKPTTDWRHYMQYFSVENWQDCIFKMEEGYDCCGVMWNTDTPIGMYPHFSGTFWWATTNYINTLNHGYLDSEWRYHREFWIGSNPNANPFEFHNSRLNDKESLIAGQGHYDVEYPEENYKKEYQDTELYLEKDNQNNTQMTLHVIITVFRRALTLRRLIDGFLLQTSANWKLHIIHDGDAPEDVRSVISGYSDHRITFTCSPQVNGKWGFPNRQITLKRLPLNHTDFVMFANDDNDYVPRTVEYFLKECRRDVGFVHCNMIHSYQNYNIFITQIKENWIDMGSFIVKLDVARHIGFTHSHEQADGTFAVECANYCRLRRLKIVHIPKCLFIHN